MSTSTKEVIVLVNFNKYLGGGETLLVRFSSFLENRGINFLAFNSEGSYIQKDLKKREISDDKNISLNLNPNFIYLSDSERKDILNNLLKKFDKNITYRFVTFTLRDLHLIFYLSKRINCSITHLILHPEDDLYVGQTLLDKFVYKIFKKREFNNQKNINFNHKLIRILNEKNGLISMTEIISNLWKDRIGVEINENYIVPLPSFEKVNISNQSKKQLKKIIWIGRIVDFKIPSLIQMIDYVNSSDYQLTIVGNGELKSIEKFLKNKNIDRNKLNFIGQVDYSKLPEIVNSHSIGYAMGTSLIELAKFKIPVIVALASFDHKNFKSQICGGLFFDKYKGCDGTDLLYIKQSDVKTTISDTIKLIEENYDFIANSCYKYAEENFSEKENFEQYLNIIKNTKLLTLEDKNITISQTSKIRKIAFKYLSNA